MLSRITSCMKVRDETKSFWSVCYIYLCLLNKLNKTFSSSDNLIVSLSIIHIVSTDFSPIRITSWCVKFYVLDRIKQFLQKKWSLWISEPWIFYSLVLIAFYINENFLWNYESSIFLTSTLHWWHFKAKLRLLSEHRKPETDYELIHRLKFIRTSLVMCVVFVRKILIFNF